MLSNRTYSGFARFSIAALALAALAWAAPVAHAGAVRYAGRMIVQSTGAAAAATASGGGAAAGKTTRVAKAAPGALSNAAGATGNAVVSAGKAAGSGIELGASAVVFGARQVPGIVARKTSAGARSLWHVLW